MKTLNLFLKMHFTSLSPDGQPISLAIVTQDLDSLKGGILEREYKTISKSFYSEFTDYDINRCDDWVKSNIVSKLNINFKYNDPRHDVECMGTLSDDWKVKGKTSGIKFELSRWLSQFSDYKLNFIVDCGWFTWYKFVELIGEWETNKPIGVLLIPENKLPKGGVEEVMKEWSKYAPLYYVSGDGSPTYNPVKIGLPKLPENFPCVPIDLNDLIIERYGFKNAQDAFNLDREELATKLNTSPWEFDMKYLSDAVGEHGKYNALWDAKVTKIIYEKLK